MENNYKQKYLDFYEKRPRRWHWILLLALIVLVITVWSTTTFDLHSITTKSAYVAVNIVKAIFHPDLTMLFSLDDSGVLYLIIQTLAIAFLGTLIGAVIAIPLSFLSATNIMPKPIAYFVRFVIMAIRTIPSFIYGLMFVSVVNGAPAGVLALAFISIGMISKIFIESIEDLDPGILESMDAAGATTFQKIRYGILPQLTPDLLSNLLYRLDMNLRDAATLGLVGAGGIGAPLFFAMSNFQWGQVGSLLIGLFVIIILIEFISTRIRNSFTKA